ncbi:MAG: hypothetical protein QM503_04445, partial [Bacteroidota bacterium]
FFSSCAKDNNEDQNQPETLEGTTWHSATFEGETGTEYYIIEFTSSTNVNGSVNSNRPEASWTGSYIINGSTITINNGEVTTGTIDGNSLNLLVDPDPDEMTYIMYTKQ